MNDQYAHGPEAAKLFGATRADEVWRAIRRHGKNYPGHIEIVRVHNVNMVHRGDLMAFASWYRVNVSKPTSPKPAKVDRRAALRAAIARIQSQ